MGIYDREYYRGETGGSGWFSGVTPVTKTIIVLNAVVFLVQQLVQNPHAVDQLFAASPDETLRHFRLWQLLTATFLHADPWHILMNMYFFWLVAREMENLYGSRDFAIFYVAAAIVSTLVWVLIEASSHRNQMSTMIGASGAVMGVAMLYTLYYPRRELYLIVFPVPMWLLLSIYLFYPLVPMLMGGGHGNVAVESHLAGAGFAFFFKQFDLRWSRLVGNRFSRPRSRSVIPMTREPSRSRTPAASWTPSAVGNGGKPASVSVLPEEQLDARLDEVLAKIAREGRSGLTEEDQRVLQEASRRARIRRSDHP
jgi:membrane associated rhomboid family serine protease